MSGHDRYNCIHKMCVCVFVSRREGVCLRMKGKEIMIVAFPVFFAQFTIVSLLLLQLMYNTFYKVVVLH